MHCLSKARTFTLRFGTMSMLLLVWVAIQTDTRAQVIQEKLPPKGAVMERIQIVPAKKSDPKQPAKDVNPTNDGPAAKEGKKDTTPKVVKLDVWGDPLPDGAVVRLGCNRFRHPNVQNIHFTQDSKKLLSVGYDRMARLWDVKTGAELKTIESSVYGNRGGTIHPDGKTIYMANYDNTLRAIDVESGKEKWNISATVISTFLYISPNGKHLAAATNNGQIQIWSTQDGASKITLTGGVGNSQYLFFNAKSDAIYAVGQDFMLRKWDLDKENVARETPIPMKNGNINIASMAISPDEKWLGQLDPINFSCLIRPLDNMDEIREIPLANKGGITYNRAITFSPDSRFIAVGSMNAVTVYGVNTLKELRSFPLEASRYPQSLTFSPDLGYLAAFTSLDRMIRVWDLRTGERMTPEGGDASIQVLAFMGDGKTVVSTDYGGLRHWDLETGKLLNRYDEAVLSINNNVTTHPNGKVVRFFSYNRGLLEWNPTQSQLKTIGKNIPVLSSNVPVAPDGKTVAAMVQDRSFEIWDMEAHKMLGKIAPANNGFLVTMPFSPDSRWLPIRDALGTRLVRTTTGQQLFDLSGGTTQQLRGNNYAFSPDSRMIGSADYRELGVWETATGQFRLRLTHSIQNTSNAFCFSPDGLMFYVGDYKGIVYCFDLVQGKEVHRFTAHKGPIRFLQMLPNGKQLISVGDEATALIWDASHCRTAQNLPPAVKKTDFETHWKTIKIEEPRKAFTSILALKHEPRWVIDQMKSEFPILSPPKPEEIQKLITELDHPRFLVRERAMKELDKLGFAAKAEFEQALTKKPSPEATERLNELLRTMERNASTISAPETRMIEILERARTPEAIAFLKELVQENRSLKLRMEAELALRRLTPIK